MSCQRGRSLLPAHFFILSAIISILRLLFRNISRVIIFTTKREQENENERKNFGVYRCINFYFITRETFDECTCTEDIPYNY